MSSSPADRDDSNLPVPSSCTDLIVIPSTTDPVGTTAEDLDPAPFVANAVIFPPGDLADIGLGIRHIEHLLFITFWPWAAIGSGDFFEYYMGDTRFAKAEDEIRTGEETQRLHHLAIPREHVPLGDVYPCYGRVVRPTGRESTSAPLTIFIKDTRPGGADMDPDLPYHSALILHLPADLQGPSAVLDAARASLGVLCTIERYPNIFFEDVIELYWNGRLVTLTLDADHVAGRKPIEVLVPGSIVVAAGSGLVTIRFRAHDKVFNYSGELQQWSQAVHLETDLDPNLLERPYFLLDGADITDVNFDTQSAGPFEVEVTVPTRLPNGTTTPAGTQIHVTLSGIRVDGSRLVEALPPFAARLGRSAFTDVNKDFIKQLINGTLQISYELRTAAGDFLGTSRRLTVTVFGTESSMPAVDIREAESGLVDPARPYITVDFPAYIPYGEDYPVTLRMEATRPGGSVEVYEQTLLAGAPPPPTRFRIVNNSDFQRFVGLGDVRVFYLVEDGVVSPPGRRSDDLLVQFGPRVATLPKPDMSGLDLLDNLDPDTVIGQVIVTLPDTGTRDGDVLVWRLLGSAVGGSTGGSIELNPSTAGSPVSFPVDKAFIDANRDGEMRLSYSRERAGAEPLRSEVRVITVGASLGDLIRPEIKEASRSPDQLTPEAVTAGATLVVSFPQMLPTDRIRATWSGIAGIGTWSETKDGNTRKSVEYTVPAEVVGVNIAAGGRDINVQYFLIRGGTQEIPSRILTVRLLPLITTPTPTIEGFGTSMLDVSRLVGHERTAINVWHFIHRAQRIWLEYSGQLAAGGNYVESTYTADLVNASAETNGILAPTPVVNLRRLRDGSDLWIRAWVSFERSTNKANAVLFRERHYVIQAFPSSLPHPFIGGASGTGPSVTVEPLALENTAQVSVKYDGMRSTDKITLRWIYADANVYSAELNGNDSGTRVFTIGNTVLARSVNSTVLLNYSVVRVGVTDPVPSATQTVRVNTISAASLDNPRINNVANNGTLDISGLTTASRLTVAPWKLQYSGMKLWMTFQCPGASPATYVAWAAQPHNSTSGLDVALPQAWLNWLKTCPNGAQLSIEFKVGYANNSTEAQAVSFPVTRYTVMKQIVIVEHTNFDDRTSNGWVQTNAVLPGYRSYNGGLFWELKSNRERGLTVSKTFSTSQLPPGQYELAIEFLTNGPANLRAGPESPYDIDIPLPDTGAWMQKISVAFSRKDTRSFSITFSAHIPGYTVTLGLNDIKISTT
ncbi:hypothetical protein [Pseudomonas sp. ADAK13]|uniref:hypothetical protein n=1 Tax=Pseudomonas sp. ADAK13 TaxID=2730847 RepID=UPI001462E4D2|nr:hypothetical protein [Pseudomonas sp. ADAK13]QJI37517.1 hypothetical protein HKK54_24955 [Pseudomonas sp. ADAK13]